MEIATEDSRWSRQTWSSLDKSNNNSLKHRKMITMIMTIMMTRTKIVMTITMTMMVIIICVYKSGVFNVMHMYVKK